MKILNFGSCNIDYVYNVSEFVKAGETISALSTSEHPGGKGGYRQRRAVCTATVLRGCK